MQTNAAKSNNSDIKLRPLISYALSSHAISEGKDYFEALLPIFTPIVSDNRGKIFNPDFFCEEIKKHYGLNITKFAIDNFTDKMVKAGLLVQTNTTGKNAIYRYSHNSPDLCPEEYMSFKAILDQIFSSYHQYIDSMPSLTASIYNKQDLENGLIDWVLKSDNRLNSITSDYKSNPTSELDYVASRFLENLEKNDIGLFDQIAMIHTGAIVSELVLDFRAPNNTQNSAEGLNIYLDAPFVMHLLKLSGQSNYLNAEAVLKQMLQLKAKVHIFNHSCEEIYGNIDAVLNPNNHEKWGPLASALHSKEIMPEYVRTIKNNLEEHIKKLNITILNPDSFGEQEYEKKFFKKEFEDRLYCKIPWGADKDLAKRRDIASISTVMKKRRGRQERDYLKTKHLFITTNKSLAKITRDFCIDENILNTMHAPPVLSLDTFAGVLFLALGNNKDAKINLSRRQLLTNCCKVAITTPEFIQRFNEKIASLDPNKTDQISIILSEPRSAQLALDLTYGNPEAITEDNFEEAIRIIQSDLIADAEKKHKQELESNINEKNKINAENERLKLQQRSVFTQAVKDTSKQINTIRIIVQAFFLIAFSYLAFSNLINQNTELELYIKLATLISSIAALTVNILTILWLPKPIVSYIINIKKKRLLNLIKERGLPSLSSMGYSVNWDTLEVTSIDDGLL